MPDVKVEITGAKELRRAIRRAEGPELRKNLRSAYKSSAGIVSTRAESVAPALSGDLRSSIRPLGSQSKAQVAAGRGRSKDYAGVIHYGWPARGIEPQEFLHEALEREWDNVYDFFEQALEEIGRTLSTT